MSRYDEDRVIALLREVVPPVPEAPDRIAAVKHRAGRQRTTMWTQTLGAVASVLLVVGVAAAVTGPQGPRRIDPTDEPLQALALALVKETSVRFEATLEPVGEPRAVPQAGLTSDQVREMLASRVTGAATRDGDFRITGDASFMSSWAFGYDLDASGDAGAQRYDVDFRVVDGVAYRTPSFDDEDLPAGKKWISDRNSEVQDVDDLRRALNQLGMVAENVRYVREYEIASEPVAEYELTIPAKVTSSVPVKVRFALDAADRLRRVTSQFSLSAIMMGGSIESESAATLGSGDVSSGWTEYPQGGEQPDLPRDVDPLQVKVQVDLFGYGEDVDITAPPAREVVTEESLYNESSGSGAGDAIGDCLEAAAGDLKKQRACFETQQRSSTVRPSGAPPAEQCVHNPDGSFTCTDSTSGFGFGGGPPASARPSPGHATPRATLSPAA